MRLLNVNTLDLKEFFGDDIPSYAILSHTWGKAEVSFQDLIAGTHRSKAGWNKILGCCKQALQDKLYYVWVDTCCIDKTSSAELQEAINSMFRWYKKSKMCYAYLEDIQDIHNSSDSFTRSRWFSRGWTLQELIAPSRVLFFDAHWRRIGSQVDDADAIAGVTGIDSALLQHARSPNNYSVAQRFSWAAGRQTTRPEDRAYSLLGLFDVFMPLLYGEGDRAFVRLQHEILKTTTDLSILAWPSSLSPTSDAPLAFSLNDFANCGSIDKIYDSIQLEGAQEVAVGPLGLRMTVPIIDFPTSYPRKRFAAIFKCQHSFDVTTFVALKLTADSEASKAQDAMAFRIGWLGDGPDRGDRLVLVDALEARKRGKLKKVLIVDNSFRMQFLGSHRTDRQISFFWIRFCDQSLDLEWVTQDLHPNQFWTKENRTFDLVKAAQTAGLRPARSDEFGPPTYGAIALCGPMGDQVAIYFKVYNISLGRGQQDLVRFRIRKYYRDRFEPLRPLFEDEVNSKIQRLDLANGSRFWVRLTYEEVGSKIIAHLAAAVTPRRISLETDEAWSNDKLVMHSHIANTRAYGPYQGYPVYEWPSTSASGASSRRISFPSF